MATTYAGKGNGINGGNHASVTYYDALTEGSPDASITNLLTGAKWGTALGQSAIVQVSFSNASSSYTGGLGGLLNFSTAQIDAARTVMAKWQAVANLTFTEVTDSATNAGDIRWANSTSSTATNGYTYYPSASSNSSAGDIYVGTGITNPVRGNRSYLNYLHEFGHSIGLRHPHDSSAAVPTPAGEDQLKYTVMSYRDYAGDSLNGYSTQYFPTTPMLNDVLTIQFLYGANMSYHTGDDVYQWAADKIIYETIWDAGGNDTIDASNQAQSVSLNLNCGQWNQIGVAFSNSQATVRDCLTIAYGATIENAVGSAFADNLIGNSVANSLTGGLGNDTLKGGAGNDTLSGGDGNDQYLFNLGDGIDHILETAGTDKVLFGTGISATQITANLVNGEVILKLSNTDSLGFAKLATGYSIESFEFSGASILTSTWVDSLLNGAVWTNTAPTAADKTINLPQNISYNFSSADFGFSDVDGDALASVKITSLETAGALKLSGVDVALNQIINAASLVNLSFTPAVNASGNSYANFNFTVNDGAADSAVANTIVFNVTAIVANNNAPALTTTVVALPNSTEDTAYSLTATQLLNGWTDADNDVLSVANLTANHGTISTTSSGYSFSPAANYSGAVTFSYNVVDGKGASVAATRSLNLTNVNDAPTGAVTISDSTPAQGQTLTVANNLADADGLGVISYQWQANNVAIIGANKASYLVAAADVGKNLSVTASYTDLQGKAETVNSIATSAVIVPVVNPVTFADLFQNSTANWVIQSFPDANSSFTTVQTYSASLSSGYLQIGDPDSGTFYFAVNNIGHIAAYYGGYLTYSLSDYGSGTAFDAPAVILSGGGLRLIYVESQIAPAMNSFTDYKIPLFTTNQWYVMSGIEVSPPTLLRQATINDFNTVLNADTAASIAIRGEYISGGDTGYLSDAAIHSVNHPLAGNVNIVGSVANDLLTGGNGDDKLNGSAGNDTVNGGKGSDLLNGGAGADNITGGYGKDTLIGGSGKDILTGGANADTFKFNAVSESGIKSITRDVIVDFNPSEGDKINLSTIDADTVAIENNAFATLTVGGVFSGVFANRAELYFDQTTHILYGNNDVDAQADFSILLTGISNLTIADLIL